MNNNIPTKRFQRRKAALASPLREEMHRVGTFWEAETFVLDIEATNRCQARCTFCPRDETPHQGFMTLKTFEQVLVRAVEFRAVIERMEAGKLDFSFCGLGEAKLNPLLPEFMRLATAQGFNPCLCANGGLLDEERAQALLDAGLKDIFLNIAELGANYDLVYGLSFERTVHNVERFMALAAGRCNVWIVLVDHSNDPVNLEHVRAFWHDRGVRRFYPSPMLNRAGAIDRDDLNFNHHPMESIARHRFGAMVPACYAPIQCLSIGYDGIFYLCNSDWRKEEPAGSVFDISVMQSIRIKLARAKDREHSICRRCNHDPLNQISRMLAEGADAALVANCVDVLSRRDRSADAFLRMATAGGYLTE